MKCLCGDNDQGKATPRRFGLPGVNAKICMGVSDA